MDHFENHTASNSLIAPVIEKPVSELESGIDERRKLAEELEEIFDSELPCTIKGHGVNHSVHGENQPATMRGYPPCEKRYAANICRKFYENLALAKPVMPCECGKAHFFEEFHFVKL